MPNPQMEDFWVQGNKAAAKILEAMHIANMVRLPAWHDVKHGLLRRPRAALVERPADTGHIDVGGLRIDWAPHANTNLGGQYDGLQTIKFGQRIYVKVYGRTETGAQPGQCPVPDFHLRVLQDLTVMALFTSGQRILRSIDHAAGGNILIKYCDGFTTTSQVDGIAGFDPGRLPAFDGNPRSANRNVYVQYNPALAGLPIMVGNVDTAYDKGNWGHPAEKPTDVTLFHELVHADDCVNGVFDAGVVQRGTTTVKLSELRAVGLAEFRGAPYSENSYRAEGGLADRGYYSDEAKEGAVPDVPIVPSASTVALLRWLGAAVPSFDETTREQVIPRLKDTPILTIRTFKQITDAWGRRNKVKPVDDAVRALDDLVQQLLALDPDGTLKAMTGASCTSVTKALKDLADACKAYQDLVSRQTSDRMPGVRSLHQAALRALALYSIAGGDVRGLGDYFDALPNHHIRDLDGNAQFGLAIERSRDRDNLNWLIAKGIDVNSRHRGLRPVDITRMEGRIIPEQVLAGRPLVKSDLPDSITLAGTNYVDCLVEGTFVDPEFGMDARSIYQHLWDSQGGMFRPILKIAAYAMSSGPRLAAVTANGAVPLRVYLYAKGKSTCHASNNVVSVIKYTDQTATEGGLIHELTHFISHYVYAHDVMPFVKTTGTTDGQAYIVALARDAQRAEPAFKAALRPFLPDPAVPRHDATATIVARLPQAPNADGITATRAEKFVFTLFNRLNGYINGTMFRGVPMPLLQEAIVSFPQALHAYGSPDDARNHAPELYTYFENTFLPELQTWVNAKEFTRAHPTRTVTRRTSIVLSTGMEEPSQPPQTRGRARSLR